MKNSIGEALEKSVRWIMMACFLLIIIIIISFVHDEIRARSDYFHVGNFVRELGYLERGIWYLREYYVARVASEDLPYLGVFRHDDLECVRFDKEYLAPHGSTSLWRYYSNYHMIISLDFNTRRLYTGFADLKFLKKSFSAEHKNEIHRKKMDEWISHNAQGYGQDFLVQNIEGERFARGGDTVLTFVVTLSSDDVGSIRNKNNM